MAVIEVFQGKTERLKIVVLDANFYWSQQLFSACNYFADILLLKPRDYRSFYKEHRSYFTDLKPKQIGEHVWEQYICCPPGWLFNYWFIAKHFFASIIKRFQRDCPLVFVYCYPHYSSLVSELNCYSVYYSFDDYTDYWSGKETLTLVKEDQAINLANLIVCTASIRAEIFRKRYVEKKDLIMHLSHGCSPKFMVDSPLFSKCSSPQTLGSYPRPIAGYIGALSYRFDFKYLAQVAEIKQDITFVLGGSLPQEKDGSTEWWQGVKAIQKLSNVHFIGKVPHQKVGEYLLSFDILLMCYSVCDFNYNICPMKLWDYMGTSLPIVSNDSVPEVNLWKELLHIAQSPSEYASKIEFALNNIQWKSQERWIVAESHTWKHQAQKLYQSITLKTPLLIVS